MVILTSTFVFANFNTATDKNTKKVVLSKTVNVDEAYVKEETESFHIEDYIKTCNNYLEVLNITEMRFDSPEIETYKNNTENQTEVIISDSNMVIKLEKESKEFLSYIHKNTSFKENTLSDEAVKEVAMRLFENLDIFENYEMYSLEKFDEELYLARFFKKYDEHLNPGEMICFSFSPEAKEIVSLTKKSMIFANNDIIVSTSEAHNIALPYLEKSVATDMTIELEIVEPNYGLLPELDSNCVYQRADETRLAYVCKFNNEAKTEVYIDCTTGEIIGADWIAGGEF